MLQYERLAEQLDQDPQFRAWFISHYTPIAGGWQY